MSQTDATARGPKRRPWGGGALFAMAAVLLGFYLQSFRDGSEHQPAAGNPAAQQTEAVSVMVEPPVKASVVTAAEAVSVAADPGLATGVEEPAVVVSDPEAPSTQGDAAPENAQVVKIQGETVSDGAETAGGDAVKTAQAIEQAEARAFANALLGTESEMVMTEIWLAEPFLAEQTLQTEPVVGKAEAAPAGYPPQFPLMMPAWPAPAWLDPAHWHGGQSFPAQGRPMAPPPAYFGHPYYR